MWIEIPIQPRWNRIYESRLARALWIEILTFLSSVLFLVVEARESLVDRNITVWVKFSASSRRGSREPCGSKFHILHSRFLEDGVEARESLVDRNGTCSIHSSHIAVEARESLVDRNPAVPAPQSLSACRGSREPCGLKCRRPFPEGRQLCRGSREPCGFKFYRWNILFYRPCK